MTRLVLQYWCIILIFLSCQGKHESASQKPDENTISDNISNQHITSFTEDRQGYIWIGTSRGLNKFNGYEYRQYFKLANDSLSLCGNNINSIRKDSQNRLWIATENGVSLLKENGEFRAIPIQNKRYPPVQIIETGNKEIIINLRSHLCKYDSINHQFKDFYQFDQYNTSNKCHVDKNNQLWVISLHTIKCFDYPTLRLLKEFDIEKRVNLFYSYLIDDRLFVAHGKGNFQMIDINKKEYLPIPEAIKKHPVLSHALITIVHPYGKKKLLLNTHKNGVYIYDYKNDSIRHQSDKGFPFELPGCEITSIFSDSQHNLWVGTLSQGFKVVYKYSQQFNHNTILRTLTDGQSVTALTVDNNDNLWVATHSDHLYIYNTRTSDIDQVDLKNFFPEDPYFQDKIFSIHVDNKNNVWFQTDSKLVRCNYKNKKLTGTRTFNMQEKVYNLAEDNKGTIWAGTWDNFLCAIPEGADKYQKLVIYPTNYKYYRSCLLALSSGKVLIATSGQYLSIVDPNDWSIDRYSMKDLISGKNFIPTVIYEDSDHNIWVGILDQGLYKFSVETRQTTKIGDIPCKDISSIIEDADKNLWIGTLYGLSKYDPKQKRFFTFYAYDGIGGNQFNKNSVTKLPDGNLVFGGTHGLTIFDPLSINIQRQIPLYFEEIKSHVQITSVNNKIELKHNENDLNISYVALDFSKYPRVRYYYKMEGFDNQWIDAGNNRKVLYSNLPSGNYTFKVYLTSNNSTVVLAENSFDVHISPSPWLSTWALLLYGVLVVSFIVYVNKLYLRIRNNKNKAQIALREKEHEKLVNHINMSFFANISHEFRTPLTMIAGPVSTLSHDESLSEKNKHLLKIINRSVSRMLRLVNQILYVNKLDNDVLLLDLRQVDVIHDINEIIEVFSVNDNIKNIHIKTYGLDGSFFMLLDKDILEKIVNNILSNAFKYSPDNGTINVRFDVISCTEAIEIFSLPENDGTEDYIRLVVEDDGPGIPEDKLEDIFRRYYQVGHSSSDGIYNWGTGIGLYFARRLAELHHGYIKAGNKKDKGAVFTVIIPVAKSKPGTSDTIEQRPVLWQPTLPDTEDPTKDSGPKQVNTGKANILVVDDDAEISAYIHTLLSDDYNVINKYDAGSAYAVIEEVEPDLILCDVIMPGVSGYELCRNVKTNEYYCHIPVVLLTAKSSLGEQIEGLDTGANAYITKPFEPTYLLAVIKSQILNLQNIRNLLGNSTKVQKADNVLSNNDRKFMNELYELMENELSDSELNILKMTKEIGMSRTKFYCKVKGLTGESPNIFFRKYKLNRAAELIKTGDYNISEIADLTGFRTLSHFSVSFKKQFGISPKNYK
jgi:signal transduction histidine kinase/ligand-binding sensor domain-containing protein/DNA-binding response OmpR family regulator